MSALRATLAAGAAILLGLAGAAEAKEPVRMQGMMRYMADAALYRDCLTGHAWPLAEEQAYMDLQRAYIDVTEEAGAPTFVLFMGRVEMRPKFDGPGDELTAVPSRLIGAFPGLDCASAAAEAPLIGTEWQILNLYGEPLAERPARLRLKEGGWVEATVGCNALQGQVEQTGTSLKFRGMVSTRKACPPPLPALEHALRDMLSGTRRISITGPVLEILGSKGTPLGLLRAADR
ncbi:MAG: META domain-containing protein, partial [Pseudomonadota bacterium]